MTAVEMTFWGAAAFAGLGLLVWWRAIRMHVRIEARLRGEVELLDAMEQTQQGIDRRCRDLAEAIALAEYGARQEAIALLMNWGGERGQT